MCVHVSVCVGVIVPQYNIEENSCPAALSNVNSLTPAVQPTDSGSASSDEQTQGSASGCESLSTTPVLSTPLSKCDSVGFSFGTPVEADEDAGGTPYGTAKLLPDRSRFAVGVSDHILYENLPNATGTFKRLREVLQSFHSSSPASSSS